MCYTVPLFTPKGDAIDHPVQLRLFGPDEEPTTPEHTPRPYSSWNDTDLQDLVILDVHAGHHDDALKNEFDARMSQALLDLFENLGPDPETGITLKLHPGLKRKLQKSAEHLVR